MPAPTDTSLPWPDEFTLSSFQVALDSLSGTTGFAVAAVSLVRNGWLHAVVSTGRESLTSWQLEADVPAADVEKLEAWGETWGACVYVAHDVVAQHRDELPWVGGTSQADAGTDADQWRPLSLIFAPFRDDAGELVGILFVDQPATGRLPGTSERAALERFAGITGKAVLAATLRDRVAHRLELAEATRGMIRSASSELEPETLFARIRDALLDCFGLENAWARIFATPEAGESVWVADPDTFEPPSQVSRLGDPVGKATELWRLQRMGLVYVDGRLRDMPDDEDIRSIRAWSEERGLASLSMVPLGHGDVCVGALTVARTAGAPDWDEAEIAAATEIGRDLGQVIRLSQAFAREQATVRRLRELDAYRSRFVAMVSHELKNPLTAILANLELLDDVTAGDPTAGRAVASVNRAARRMTRLVDDLLLLARAADPERPLATELLDLTEVIRDVCELNETTAAQRELDVRIEISPYGPMTVAGDAAQLDRVVVNLVSNALKYTPGGRSITIGLRRVAAEVELSVSDEGIGISDADRAQILDEFFRSKHPEVTAQDGTGLGLAIVDQIVRRHGGRLEMESVLGEGSTFRVILPAAAPPERG